VQKLDLASEAEVNWFSLFVKSITFMNQCIAIFLEANCYFLMFILLQVEILLRGKPVLCSMRLQNLVEMWLETMPKNERIQTSVGSSAKDFVMVLSYSRKA
jgi:hypothetical protein